MTNFFYQEQSSHNAISVVYNNFLQGDFFLKKGESWQEACDMEADAKFELK